MALSPATIMLIIQGAQLVGGLLSSEKGADLEQAGFAQQQANDVAATNYNKSLLQIQSNRESARLGRDLRRSLSTQQADAARTGLDVGSKSFLAIMSDTITQSERELVQINNNNRFGATKLDIESRGRIQSLEIQKAAAKNRQSSSRIDSALGLAGILGTASGTFGNTGGGA